MNRLLQKSVRAVSAPDRWGRYATRLWLGVLGPLARLPVPVVGKMCARLAALGLGPYKAKRKLVKVTGRTYVSPRAQVHGQNLEIGKRCFLDDQVTIYIAGTGGRVTLEDDVFLYRGTIIEVVHDGHVRIGAGTHIQPYCIVNSVVGPLTIGRNVQVAARCGFFPYRHRIDDPDVPIQDQGYASKGGIVVEDDVWMGAGVLVMDGVRIGRGAVIGAGSVVTRDIPSHGIAVGSPARVVGRRGEGKHPAPTPSGATESMDPQPEARAR